MKSLQSKKESKLKFEGFFFSTKYDRNNHPHKNLGDVAKSTL